MKHIVMTMILASLLTACTHKLDLEDSQLDYVSPQAKEILKTREYTVFPSFVINEERIIDARNDFHRSEAIIEDSLIGEFHLRIERSSIADIPVTIITPENMPAGNDSIVGFNVHGGAFVMGTGRDRSALLIAGYMKIKIISVDYSLAPEVKYPGAIKECLEVYKRVTSTHNPAKIIGISSSAGGNLMLAMLLMAQEQGVPMMRAQVLFTPNGDVTIGGDSGVGNDGRDVLPHDMSVDVLKKFYVGDADIKDPYISPVYGSFKSGFPASIIVTGSRDLSLSSCIRLMWKLKEVNVHSELLVGEGMWHGFHWDYELPEAVAALNDVCRFLNGKLKNIDMSAHIESTNP